MSLKSLYLIACALIIASFLGILAAQEPKPKTFSVQDMKPEDQQKAQDLIKQVNELLRDLELYQAKIELSQAKITRINEVQLPALQDSLRATYNLPKDLWDFNLQTFTFTKKSKP